MSAPLTEAEERALRWLIGRHGLDATFRGGDLVDYYHEREIERTPEKDRWMMEHATTPRRHAWRRTGGTVLGRIARKGYLRGAGTHWGTALYRLTPEGRGLTSRGLGPHW